MIKIISKFKENNKRFKKELIAQIWKRIVDFFIQTIHSRLYSKTLSTM